MTNVDADVLLSINAHARNSRCTHTTITSDMEKYSLRDIMDKVREMAAQSNLLETNWIEHNDDSSKTEILAIYDMESMDIMEIELVTEHKTG